MSTNKSSLSPPDSPRSGRSPDPSPSRESPRRKTSSLSIPQKLLRSFSGGSSTCPDILVTEPSGKPAQYPHCGQTVDEAPIRLGIITVDDACFMNDMSAVDTTSQLRAMLETSSSDNCSRFSITHTRVAPKIAKAVLDIVQEWTLEVRLDVVVTLGACGFYGNDCATEVIRQAIEREAPTMQLALMQAAMCNKPRGLLFRPCCGIKDRTLILSLPLKPEHSKVMLAVVVDALPHAVNALRTIYPDRYSQHYDQ